MAKIFRSSRFQAPAGSCGKDARLAVTERKRFYQFVVKMWLQLKVNVNISYASAGFPPVVCEAVGRRERQEDMRGGGERHIAAPSSPSSFSLTTAGVDEAR